MSCKNANPVKISDYHNNVPATSMNAKRKKSQSNSKLVLLAERQAVWPVPVIKDVYNAGADVIIEDNAELELPSMKWGVYLDPDPALDYLPYPTSSRFRHIVRCILVEGNEELSERNLFYKIDFEIMNGDGETVWRKFSSGAVSVLRNNLPCLQQFSLQRPGPKRFQTLPERPDGSILFRFTFQFFKVEEGSGHFETRAEVDKASVKRMKEDVQLVCSDGKRVKFHKQLLVARSPVFEAMFRSGMKESKSGIVKLQDLTGEAVQFIHHFLYDGKLQSYLEKVKNGENGSLKDLEQWIYMASKYQFTDLLKFFDRILINFCDEGNALELLKMSNRFMLENGREDVKAFVLKHPQVLNNL